MVTAGRTGIAIALGLTLALLPAGHATGPLRPTGEAAPQVPSPPVPTGPQGDSAQRPADAVPPAVQTQRLQALNFLIRAGLLPPESATRTTPITRAELARLIVGAIGYNTLMVSEFPFYRDVPVDLPDYAPIEVAREKRLIDYPEEHGFYHPGQAIRFAELYGALGKVLRPPAPSDSANRLTVESFADGNRLPAELVTPVAKMAYANFFPQTRQERHETYLLPQQEVSAPAIAPFIVRLMQVAGTHTQLEAALPSGAVAFLPAGLSMTVTPTASLFRSRLAVGDTVTFSLVNNAGPLIKGSRFRGRVESVADGSTYRIRLYEVRTVNEDQFFETNTILTLVFPEKDEKAFVVPGQVFEITSGAPEPPVSQPGAGNPTGTSGQAASPSGEGN